MLGVEGIRENPASGGQATIVGEFRPWLESGLGLELGLDKG